MTKPHKATLLAMAILLLAAGTLAFFHGLKFGQSFDPAIAFQAHDASAQNHPKVEVDTDELLSLYRYTLGLRNELSTFYLSLSAISILLAAGLLIFSLRFRPAQSKPQTHLEKKRDEPV